MKDDPDFGKYPGLPRTFAIGLALAGMVGGLYLLAASYHMPGDGSLAYQKVSNITTALFRTNPPQPSGS